MYFLDYQKHPMLLALILAILIALWDYVMLTFFSQYVELIFDVDIFNLPQQFPEHLAGAPHPHMPPPNPYSPSKLFTFTQIIANLLLAFTLYIANFYIYGKLKISTNKQIVLSIVFTLVATAIFCTLSIYLDIYLRSTNGDMLGGPRMMEVIDSSIMRDTIVAIIVIFSTLLMYYIKKQEIARLENEALIAENMRSRFNALTAKLDPHFLFNSLNTLKSLIKSNPEKAQEYTQQLSDIFRYTINHKDIITLREEVEFSKVYGDMMLMRYENSLNIIYNVEAKYFDYKILPFCIQTLIENAVKHNTITTKRPLNIEIYSDDDEHMIIKNRKSPKKIQEVGNGLGLKNLNDRYKYQFKREIEIFNLEEEFIVKVPIIK